MLEDFDFERLEGGLLVLRRRDDASPGVAYVMQHPQGLEDLATAAFGRRMQVQFVQKDAAADRADRAPVEDEARAAMEHPLVREAMELFDAHVVEVRRLPDSTPSTTPTQQKED